MLLVKTKLRLSKINGIGLFADQFIKRGTKIWKWNPIVDYEISSKEFKSLPTVAKKVILHFSYMNSKGDYIMCGDNARFWNHSNKPNCFEIDSRDGKEPTIAIRDIKRGKEMTLDYYSFDVNYKKGIKRI